MSEDQDILDRPLIPITPIRDRLRFSASAASKYHNCHASANLLEAIPGFEFKEKERAKSRDQGTALHKVLEQVVTHGYDYVKVATMLRSLADVFGKNRTALLQDEKQYLIWCFMGFGEIVLEHEYLSTLLFTIPNKETGEPELNSTPPKLIRFLAEAIEYIAQLLEDGGEILTEATVTANWLQTKPKTTIDILIRKGNVLYVIDLKAGTMPIPAIENEQLLYYAACFIEDEDDIRLVILQCDNVNEWYITREHLFSWMETMKVSEQKILDKDLSFRVGSHCSFCPANPRGRGDRGYPFCPEQIELLYGAENDADSDVSILED
jgi:hypothetical protein